MKPVRPKTLQNQRSKPSIKDPIEVYCRIRPLGNRNELTYIYSKDNKTVVMVPPDKSFGTKSSVHYFQHVFNEEDSQATVFNHVTLPIIKDLLQGINGLIFTYGITSSGKTYTMTGSLEQSGILPKSLDVIFNSLKGCIAPKFVFKPDKLNGFDIQTTAEAALDLNKETSVSNKNKTKRKEYLVEWNGRIPESTALEDVNTDCSYSIFVSYVEIYNNYIYDLLEEMPPEAIIRPKERSSKMLRNDQKGNVYVFGTTEIEVKSADEALEAFAKGQQRRKISSTALNAESSRSHSVFTVRIAQAPLDDRGVEVLQNLVTVSQLSMVDLAGSERTQRTKNAGHKLQETGNINTSLMNLKRCIEILRENQMQGSTKLIPYRDDKLTHLFKTNFEGEGKVRMIVCVNPSADDFKETTHVMEFAEMTQGVMISRATPVSTPVSFNLRFGRGNLYKEAMKRAREEKLALDNFIEPVVYSLGPEFPPLILNGTEESLENLMQFLEARKERRTHMIQGFKQRQEDFRKNLMITDRENTSLKQENSRLKMDLKAREQQVTAFENEMHSYKEKICFIQQKDANLEHQVGDLKQQLNEKQKKIAECEKEKEKMKTRLENRMELEKERMKKDWNKKLAEKEAELRRKLFFDEEKLRQFREILNDGDWEPALIQPSERRPNVRMARAKTTLAKPSTHSTAISATKPSKSNSEPRVDQIAEQTATTTQYKSVAVCNPRHRRSQSSNADVWLEHKPIGSLELGTVLQPKMKKKISVSKLEVKDVLQNDVSKYVLTHQEQDSNGEVETQLYKADVIPSAGGGAQVIFNDIEKLKQASPPPVYNLRKRSADNVVLRDIETKCSVAVECHGVPSKVVKKTK